MVLLVFAAVSFAAARPTDPVVSEPAQPRLERSAPAPVVRDTATRAAKVRPPPPMQKPALVATAPPKPLAPPPPAPETIEIPALGIDQDVIELAVSGTDLQVPSDYFDIGWWRDGPSAGENGAAVMVGHVDSETGPAVFYQLSGLSRGHEIEIDREDGSRMTFAVRRVRAFSRADFPSAEVYRTGGPPALHLVTCGGTFDQAAGQYSGNVVVFAQLVDRQPAPRDRGAGPTAQQEPTWTQGAGESHELVPSAANDPSLGRARGEDGERQ